MQSLRDPGGQRLYHLIIPPYQDEIPRFATAKEESTENHTVTLKCFHIKLNHITSAYFSLARESHMVMAKFKRHGRE